MSASPHAGFAHDLDLVRASADQLVHDVTLLGDDALGGPSLLPGWSRAQVVGHLIGNAEGLTRLVEWARTGTLTPQYADQQQKDAGINGAVGMGADALATRLREATDTFVAVADQLDPAQQATSVRLGVAAGGREIAAGELAWRRLVEQEVHNVDLAGAYTPAHWSPELVERLLTESSERYLTSEDVPPMALDALDGDWAGVSGELAARTSVAGPSPALLAWLTGRSSGEGLHVDPPGPLPALPPWF
ncbi:MAG: maleylpyruvate isomerase family mycothiol-dependent enzyme [Jiangellales bacterium]